MTAVTSEGVVRAAVTGELEISTAGDFKRIMLEELQAHPEAERASVDLTGSPFIDSTALGALFSLAKEFKRRTGRSGSKEVQVIISDKNMSSIFRTTGIVNIIEIIETEDQPQA
jgi:anti-anti-sigma factor